MSLAKVLNVCMYANLLTQLKMFLHENLVDYTYCGGPLKPTCNIKTFMILQPID